MNFNLTKADIFSILEYGSEFFSPIYVKALNGKSMHLIRIREGVSPAESIPGKAEQKVHPGADPAKCRHLQRESDTESARYAQECRLS